MTLHPADDLADAIRRHRDEKYQGGEVTDPRDLTLYGALVWFETVRDDVPGPYLDV